MFRAQAEAASDGHRASVRRWQGKDRFYRQVQRAAAPVVSASEEAQDVMEDLVAVAQPLQDNVVVWGGVRSIDDTFGVPTERLEDLIGSRRASAQFCNIGRSGHCRKGIHGTGNQSGAAESPSQTRQGGSGASAVCRSGSRSSSCTSPDYVEPPVPKVSS
jgi:hypothetical protein